MWTVMEIVSAISKAAVQGPKCFFDGHIDTVPVPDTGVWTHDPFGAEIVDGRMYGRGTSI